ncbi:hypothetical protein MMRN_37740 [Mycobacterium marinum]|uniref:hypothetical protein n=1 Tax=Mycobacterium marinum TaxID=1781 RepID=UPI000CD932A6|nr:hypothetical protein [Mycobacterium marinum]AXN50871.1 hypothetical protein CCUG20998_03468 [Mycobacterium marinum]RFZ25531.1 hypothetical protein DSM43519_01717 [Mycobacterium marinum]RFZ28418.1 hypothetical protein DSM44344_01463 [Mycobacterium marinum]RFZ33755.1 hypothetical protein NCTC2275_02600 [Mycobacterium marinum]WOR02929.1 hypothetical protein QDR78_17075 [Mycobacterium marinum]
MTSNQTILRLYIKQIVPDGDHHLASDEEVLQTAMDFAAQTGVDIDDAARALELGAEKLDVTTKELVAAVTSLCVFLQCSFHEAVWQLQRVVNVVQQIEQGTP